MVSVQSASASQIDYALGYIARGKAGVLAQDPAYRELVNQLSAMGYQSIQSISQKKKYAEAQAKKAAQAAQAAQENPLDKILGKSTPGSEFLQPTAMQDQEVSSVTSSSGSSSTPLIIGDVKKESLFSFGESKDIPVYGVPIIKQSERAAGAVGYVPQASGVSEILEGGFVPYIQTSPSTMVSGILGRTERDIILTQSNIYGAEQQEKQFRDIVSEFKSDPSSFVGQEGVITSEGKISLTEDFFSSRLTSSGSKVSEAREFYRGLSDERKFLSGLSGEFTGAYALGALGTEFVGTLVSSLGQQTFKEGEAPSLLGRQFKIEGELGKFTEQPSLPTTKGFFESPITYTKEKLGDPQLFIDVAGITALTIAGGTGIVKNIRKAGFIEGTTESLGVFSPLRTKTAIYTITPTQQSPIELRSLKFQEGDITGRAIVGTGKQEPFDIISFQGSKEGSGISKTFVSSEATYIKPSGKIVEGYSSSSSRSIFTGKTGTNVRAGKGEIIFRDLEEFGSGISNTLSQREFSLFEGEGIKILDIEPVNLKFRIGKSAVIFKREGKLSTRFAFGERTPVFETKIYEKTLNLKTGRSRPTDFIRSPTGRYTFKPTITGTEIDIGNIGVSVEQPKFGFRGGTGKRTSLSTTFQQELSSQSAAINNALKDFKTPKIEIKSKRIRTKSIAGNKAETSLISTKAFTETKMPSRINISLKNKLDLGLLGRERYKTNLKEQLDLGIGSKALVKEKQIYIQSQIPLLRVRQLQKQISSQMEPLSKSIFDTGIPDISSGFGFSPVIPNLPTIFFSEPKGKRPKTSRKLGRTPSLGSALGLEFGIKTPKLSRRLEETGLVERAII